MILEEGLSRKVLSFKFEGSSLLGYECRFWTLLGMPVSGKTQFRKNLMGIRYSAYEPTNTPQKFGTCCFHYQGRLFAVVRGTDIGGSEEQIKLHWKDLVKSSNVTIFFFDVSKYLKDEEYHRQTNVRLEFLDRCLKGEEAVRQTNNFSIRRKSYAVIATHPDKVDTWKPGDETNLADRVRCFVRGKSYARLLQSHFYVANLTDPKGVSILLKKLFGIM